MNKHTPAPWEKARSIFQTDGEYDFAISAKGVPVLAEVFGRSSDGGHPPAEANADFIVTAVNSHASLTECVKVLVEALDGLRKAAGKIPADTKNHPEMIGCLCEAEIALSRAKELVP